jgi:hypothetical protein
MRADDPARLVNEMVEAGRRTVTVPS